MEIIQYITKMVSRRRGWVGGSTTFIAWNTYISSTSIMPTMIHRNVGLRMRYLEFYEFVNLNINRDKCFTVFNGMLAIEQLMYR